MNAPSNGSQCVGEGNSLMGNLSCNYNISATNRGTELDMEYEAFYETAQLVSGLVLYPILCSVGISGNVLSLIVLNQPKMVTSTNVFLSALAVADLIKLLNDTLYFIVKYHLS